MRAGAVAVARSSGGGPGSGVAVGVALGVPCGPEVAATGDVEAAGARSRRPARVSIHPSVIEAGIAATTTAAITIRRWVGTMVL